MELCQLRILKAMMSGVLFSSYAETDEYSTYASSESEVEYSTSSSEGETDDEWSADDELDDLSDFSVTEKFRAP